MSPLRPQRNADRLRPDRSAARWPGSLLAIAVATLLGACGSAPPAPSKAELRAAGLGQRAAKAFEQGDLQRARALYGEALRIDLSIENAEGIAINRINLAAVHQAAGDTGAAHRMLDEVLSGPLAASAPRRAEAMARRAQLQFQAGDLARAAHSADEARDLCRATCAANAAILVLRGRIALGAGDSAAALAASAQALPAAAGDAARSDRASALRLAGEARLARGEAQAAAAALEQALLLDQALGMPEKIALDLTLLARAREAAGDPAGAQTYAARAQAVRAAARTGFTERKQEGMK